MTKGKKTWKEKLDSGGEPHVGTMTRTISGIPAGGLMLIPIPRQVDNYIRGIPKGVSKTTKEMGDALAKEAGADISCPLCIGIFTRISAEAAHEAMLTGEKEVTPFWRIIPPKATVRKKLSFGEAVVDQLRREEGLTV